MVETDVTVYRKISEHLLQYETDHSVVSVIDEDIREMQIEADDLRAIIFLLIFPYLDYLHGYRLMMDTHFLLDYQDDMPVQKIFFQIRMLGNKKLKF